MALAAHERISKREMAMFSLMIFALRGLSFMGVVIAIKTPGLFIDAISLVLAASAWESAESIADAQCDLEMRWATEKAPQSAGEGTEGV